MINYTKEAFKRFSQIVVSIFIFDLFPLIVIRHLVYQIIFKVPKNCLISSNVKFLNPHFKKNKKNRILKIGEGLKINRNVEIDYSGGLSIGKNVWISQNVLIETHEHTINLNIDKESWNIVHSKLCIEDNVWIGANAIILSKCTTIGKNSIIGAGSVVLKDIPANVIVAGNPATIIRKLYKD